MKHYKIVDMDTERSGVIFVSKANGTVFSGMAFHEDGTFSEILPTTRDSFFALVADLVDAPTKPSWVDPE